jgi:AcrR family transcriptional regulator
MLFYERGIRAVGVDAIAEAAHVTKATLYKQFGSKDELVAEYLRARDARWRASLEDVMARHADPHARLLAVFDAYGAWLVDDAFRGCAFVNAAAELADVDHPARAAITEHKRALRERLAGLAADAGLDRPEPLAEELLLLLDGAAVGASIQRSTRPLDLARELATGLLG